MSSSHTCSQCGINGHNSRTCAESNGGGGGGGGNGIMLFGVRLTEGSSSSSCSAASASASFSSSAFRKSVSMNNLSQFDHDQHQQQHDPNANVDAGYASDDIVHASGRSKERKRGVPWTEEEHKLFLLGLQKVGKGDWRGISRNFVKTRTPTQVASHAQKYFLRRNNQNRRRRRSSLFDITTDTVMASSMEEDQESGSASQMGGFGMSAFPVALSPVVSPVVSEKPKLVRPMPSIPMPPSTKMANLNLNQKSPEDCLPLSLKLSTPSSEEKGSPKAFDKINGSGDSIVGVA